MKHVSCVLLAMLVFVLVACGAAPASRSAPIPADGATGGSAPAAEAPMQAPDQNVANPVQQPAFERLIIKNGTISLQVENVANAEAAIRAKVAELQGYIIRVETSGTEPNQYTDIAFRIPADRFDQALADLQVLAVKVLSRNVTGDDVTEEYVDLESRLRNLELTRDRLTELLQRADAVEDALSVNQALTDVQGQIEQIKGRMQFLRQNAALSTITVSLRPVPPLPTITDDNSWEPLRVARQALRDLVEFGQGLIELAIVLLIWTPVWLPIFLFLRWGWRRLTRRGKKPMPPTPPAAGNEPPAGATPNSPTIS
jgi:hypothetical protein